MNQSNNVARDAARLVGRTCEPDNWTNFIYIAREYLILIATISGFAWARRLHQDGSLPLTSLGLMWLGSILVIGASVQNRLSVLTHEASHGLLFRSRKLNDFAANAFLLFPFFGMIHRYRLGHLEHHRHVNHPTLDPDLRRLRRQSNYQFPTSKFRFVVEHIFLQILPNKSIQYVLGRASYVVCRSTTKQREAESSYLPPIFARLLWAGYQAALIALLSLWDAWDTYLMLWIAPMLSVYPAILYLREIVHHAGTESNGSLNISRNYRVRGIERYVLLPFGEHMHLFHHLYPAVPHYKVNRANAMLISGSESYSERFADCNGVFWPIGQQGGRAWLETVTPSASCRTKAA